MISGVGPFAIEAGLVRAAEGRTTVRIFNINTGKVVEASVATPGGHVTYDGETAIDGFPGTAAAIYLTFLDAVGSKTGKLLPSGNVVDRIDGIDTTLVDAAMPLMLVRAADFGKTCRETPAELEADRAFMTRLEALRIKAGHLMGIPDAADRVIPKPCLVAPPAGTDAKLAVRYFTPHQCHKSLAITGSVALGMACVTPGTLAHEISGSIDLPATLAFEHPAGQIEARLELRAGVPYPVASLVRTARRLFEGAVLVKRAPASIPKVTQAA
jgi:2-methylaconitate cis-trans-isomerase PrpF